MNALHNGSNEQKRLWIGMLMCLFVVGGLFGFAYETIFYIFNSGKLLRRGAMFLPLVPIYSFGSILIFLTTYDLRHSPWLVMLISGLASGILEFVIGYLMFHLGNGYRAWDYNVEIWNWGNIGGYVCFRSVAFFAVSGLLLIYVILPLVFRFANWLGTERFFTIMAVAFAVVALDFVYNYIIAAVLHLTNARDVFAALGWPSE